MAGERIGGGGGRTSSVSNGYGSHSGVTTKSKKINPR